MDLTKVASPPDRKDVLPADPRDSPAVTLDADWDKHVVLRELVPAVVTAVTDIDQDDAFKRVSLCISANMKVESI